MKKNLGYTLIELLSVIAILVIISGIVTGILFSTLRGTNKTKINTEVSQNGAYAMSVITNDIIDSGSVTQVNGTDIADCVVSPTGTSITLRRLDESLTTYSCANNQLLKDGNVLINSDTVNVTSCSFTCKQQNTDSYSIPSVDVKFTIQEKIANFADQKSSLNFNTSITMRNYIP